jgi:ubiquinone/menaquinone biosynthesis C-methylase UbiE
MGYVFDFKDTAAYHEWLNNHRGSNHVSLETRLMLNMLNPNSRETVLDIGCGTGASTLPFLERGLQATGIDPSQYMLDIAHNVLQNRVDLYRGFAEDLPFEDNSFNHACLFTTLEFVEDPRKALEEAFRVTKDRVFIGVLNRYAIKGIERRVKGIFSKTIYNRARFFSVWELKQIIRDIMGNVPVSWRTVRQFPETNVKIANIIEASGLAQRFPFGAFAGIVVTLVPRLRTKPLTLKYRTKQVSGAATGFAGSVNLNTTSRTGNRAR